MSFKDMLIEKIAGSNGAFRGKILIIEIKNFSYETIKNYFLFLKVKFFFKLFLNIKFMV